jgi:hypothetical protein
MGGPSRTLRTAVGVILTETVILTLSPFLLMFALETTFICIYVLDASSLQILKF